jgi:hypothetical protein
MLQKSRMRRYFCDSVCTLITLREIDLGLIKRYEPDLKTAIFTDAKTVIGSIIDYATRKVLDLIVIRRTGVNRFLMASVQIAF